MINTRPSLDLIVSDFEIRPTSVAVIHGKKLCILIELFTHMGIFHGLPTSRVLPSCQRFSWRDFALPWLQSGRTPWTKRKYYFTDLQQLLLWIVAHATNPSKAVKGKFKSVFVHVIVCAPPGVGSQPTPAPDCPRFLTGLARLSVPH